MIIGTAGHIDHGKTTLVRALTGVDTDRLPEEKRRGITIELGFAPLDLPGVGRVGIVDVPGHEAFVRTMVAGATGIDAALLVVAADEGVMPQTREHLAILGLLGTRGGVVAITKADLVEPDWLALVRQDVAESLRGSVLEAARIIDTSATTGAGLDELRQALAEVLGAMPVRNPDDLFRLPVDRVFAVKGTGTVVTGTVWSGRIQVGSKVWIAPGNGSARVRSIESHGQSGESAQPGTRTALALVGLDVADVPRGSWITDRADWPTSRAMRAEVSLGPEAGELRPREWVRLHLGTREVGARVVARGGPLQPGETRPVRLVLDAPIVTRCDDRFVLRRPSPARTIGGGVVVDPLPLSSRFRPWPAALDPSEAINRLLTEAGTSGLPIGDVALRAGIDAAADLPSQVSGRLYHPDVLREASDRIVSAVNDFHSTHKLSDGVPEATLASQLRLPVELLSILVTRLVESGSLERRGSLVTQPGWQPVLEPADLKLMDAVLADLAAAGPEPPTAADLSEAHHRDVVPFLRILERRGEVIAVEPERYFASGAVAALTRRLREGMEEGREYSPAELREILGLSRKFLIPFLEFCDRMRHTERRGTGRVLLQS